MGISGSGKTTYARRVAASLGAQHVELDALYHQENWSPRPDDEFRAEVAAAVAGDVWTVDGNYRVARALMLTRAQVIVAFDLPKGVVMRQITARSVSRGALRRELWNGNRESLVNLVRPEKERNMVLWAFSQYETYRAKIDWIETLAGGYGVEFVRVRSHDEAEREISHRLGPAGAAFLG